MTADLQSVIRTGIDQLSASLLESHRRGADIAETANRLTGELADRYPGPVGDILGDLLVDLVDAIRSGRIS